MNSIETGRLRLPSFQRGVAWDAKRVESMLNTIISDLPLGVALVLNVGNEEKFVSRALHSAPDIRNQVAEHLLDGQQRLTALYRALRDNDEGATYFLHFPEFDDDPTNDDLEISALRQARWYKRDTKFPVWADSPKESLQRGLVPVRLLDPGEDRVQEWVEAATAHLDATDDIDDIAELKARIKEAADRRAELRKAIDEKREVVKYFNLPYLRLPATTSKDTALSVFVNMNTNAKPLAPHDIVVAEFEGATGLRLKDLEDELDSRIPKLSRLMDIDSAVLQTQALLQGKLPNQRGYFDLDYPEFARNWELMAAGLHRAVEVIESLRIFDSERLPSAIPIPVIASLLANEAADGDRRARIDRLMRKYAWRSFFTNRYEATAATRAFADHRGLQSEIAGDASEAIPVFDETVYPKPTTAELRNAAWPKKRRSVPRAILAAAGYFGARDLADDTVLDAENVQRREYHHIFPRQLLSEAGLYPDLALNCALITWKTNRSIGRHDPLTYLEKRATAAPESSDVRRRLETHLVPPEAIIAAGPYPQAAGDALRAAVQPDFDEFLSQRAALIEGFISAVWEGNNPQLGDVVPS
ncbi:GmrSD restriction endonuclease domain-containing protein [Dietzia sp.]|uniref:GmrSD restriction endonuclease domain-containing protein n=1 Tax=Dietzia sp. TaxID=1871616 RepID=UPI002FD93D63